MKKISKILLLIMAVCLIACVFCACDKLSNNNQSGKDDDLNDKQNKGLVFTLLDDNTYEVSGYEGTDTDVIILSTYEGKAVTSIGWGAFAGCTGLTTITIPNSVTYISKYAFNNCSDLTSVIFAQDSRLTNIGEQAFSGCIGLTSIEIPSSVTSIGDDIFYNCNSLLSATFNGTKDQWNAIKKGSFLNSGTGSFTVTCSDGVFEELSGEVYLIAEKAWNDAKNKTAKDDIEISVALPTGLAADLKLTAKGTLTRTYKNDQITKIDGAVTYLSIEGLDKIWKSAGGIVNRVLNDENIKNAIVELIGDGTITLDGSENKSGTIVEGTIGKTGDVYILEGSVYLDRWFGDIVGENLDLESDAGVELECEKVDEIINLFIDKDKYFDSISLYELSAEDFTVKDKKTLTASFDGAKAMKWLLDILFEKLDAIIEGEEDDTLEEKLGDYGMNKDEIANVMNIFDKVKGYINDFFDVLGADNAHNAREAVETFVSFDGNTEATVTFNGQNIASFAFDQKANATLTKAQFNKLVNFALGIVSDFGVELPDIVNTVKAAIPGLVFKGDYKNQITASIDLTVTTTLTIK